MANFSWLFGRRQQQRHVRADAAATTTTSRRLDMLSLAVRDTVLRHGIPLGWLSAETLPAGGPAGRRVHLRLVLKTANPRFLAHVFALQRAIHKRLAQLDATSSDWLSGSSWRIDVPFGSDTTELPTAEFWVAERPKQRRPRENDVQRRLAVALADRDSSFARTVQEPPEFAPTSPMVAR